MILLPWQKGSKLQVPVLFEKSISKILAVLRDGDMSTEQSEVAVLAASED